MNNYNFPVALESIYTKAGNVVPKIQAVVRQDTGEALSPVSMRYQLIPHETVVSGAKKLVSEFGEHEEKFHMSKNGATLVYECTYKSPDQTLKLAVGDVLGLRIFVQNSYNKMRAVSVRIGFLVLKCLNGMVTPRDVFCYTCRHVNEQILTFPKPEELMPSFQMEAAKLNQFNDIVIDRQEAPYLVFNAQQKGLVSAAGCDNVLMQAQAADRLSAWELMQAFTNYTTHGAERLSNIGRINRLDRIGRWFQNVFVDGGYAEIMAEANKMPQSPGGTFV